MNLKWKARKTSPEMFYSKAYIKILAFIIINAFIFILCNLFLYKIKAFKALKEKHGVTPEIYCK